MSLPQFSPGPRIWWLVQPSDLTSDSITDVSGDGLAVVNNRVFYEEETWTVESADGERRG